MTNELFYY